MGFLIPLTFFGIDIFGFLKGRKNSRTVLDTVGYLQTFKALATEVSVKVEPSEEMTKEAQISEIIQLTASHITQQQMEQASEHVLPKEALTELINAATPPPNAIYTQAVEHVSGLLDLPQSVMDVFNN